MQKLSAVSVAIALTSLISAQAPGSMSYQSVVRNSDNNLVINQAVGMQISMLQGSATGTSVCTETHTPTTNANGLVSIEVGGGTAVSGDFVGIDWSAGPCFIKTETNPDGGTDYTITGTSQLLSVPYVFYASKAEDTDDADADPANELQVISFRNDTLYLSNGGYVYLGVYTDTQNLVINDFYLGITGGNEVELPSVWERCDKDISYDSGRVRINALNGPVQLELTDVFGAGGRNLMIGDDSYLSDVDEINTLGVLGLTDSTTAAIRLGAEGPVITGKDGNLGISNADPSSELDVNEVISATGGTSSEWNTAYGWGDHSSEGYLTEYTETDPVFGASAAAGIDAAVTTQCNIPDLQSSNIFMTAGSDEVISAPVLKANSRGLLKIVANNMSTGFSTGLFSIMGTDLVRWISGSDFGQFAESSSYNIYYDGSDRTIQNTLASDCAFQITYLGGLF